jgi:hypothetical protein
MGHIVLYNAPGPLNIVGGEYGRTGIPGDFAWNPSVREFHSIYGQITGVNLSFKAKPGAAANPISHGGGVSSVDVAIEHNTYSDEHGAAAPFSPDTPAVEPATQK